jgi:hypothetical protein
MDKALKLLHKWRHEKKPVMVPDVAHAPESRLFETRARVAFVDKTRVVLRSIEASPQTTTIDLSDASLSVGDFGGIEVRWPDGRNTVIIEE